MKVIVTGAGGCLGRAVVEKLLAYGQGKHGLDVVAVTSQNLDFSCSQERGSSVQVISTQALFECTTISSFSQADVLVNCAFPRSGSGVELEKGMQFVTQLYGLARTTQVNSIINISSQSVYSQYRVSPASESTQVCPESTYAVAKRAIELLTQELFHDVSYTNVRLASLVAPKLSERLINKMLISAYQTHQITVYGGDQRFDFMDVRDAADAIACLAMSSAESWLPYFVLGSSNESTLLDIAKLVQRIIQNIFNFKVDIAIEKNPDQKKINTSLDARLFYSRMKWNPIHSLEETIEYIAKSIL